MKKKTHNHLHNKIIISDNYSNCLMVDQYVTLLLLFSEAGLERAHLFCCNNYYQDIFNTQSFVVWQTVMLF